jgi:outer membrane scaffolding protein for murein synthesis (MipA/OmpV family)
LSTPPERGARRIGAALVFAALAASPPAQADKPLWELGMGVGALRLPHYRGSDQSHDWILPTPYVVYRGEILRADRDGARAVLVDADRFDLDISLAATAPTRSSDNRARAGMPDLAPTFEIGPNANFTLTRGPGWKLQARLPVRAAFTLESDPRSIGWLATPNLNLDLRVDGWNVGVLGGPVFASRRFHGYFFDVPAAYATATRPAYSAPGGASGWRLVSGVSRRVGPWWLGAFVAGDSVRHANFEPSPLVRRSETVAFGVAFSYVFAASPTLVRDEN